MIAAGNRGLALALAGVALLLAATLLAYRSPSPLGPDAPLDTFSAHRAKSILQELVGNAVPHPIGTAADAELRQAIVRRLSSLGYATELQTGFECNDEGVCGSPHNIVATLGDIRDRDAVLLAAHYDSVPAGPGASDDGAGVASMLEIARIVAARPTSPHPLVLLISDGEEAGLLGALLFVHRHPLAGQVKAAVNLEARGTSGASLMFETGTANTWLMHLLGSAIARPVTNSLYYVVYKQLRNDTDFTVFKTAGYQGFNFAFIGHVGRYHTPLDNVANADAGSIQQQGDNALAALWALANSPTLHPPIAESVFFDVFTQRLMIWPTARTMTLALLCTLLLLAEAAILLRRAAVSVREIIWGAVGTLCMLCVAVALCAALLALCIAMGKVPALGGPSWIAHPLPMHMASAALVLLGAAGAGAWLARRAGFWGFWVAAALQDGALAVAAAGIMPGASFVFLLTAMAAGLGALPATVSLLASRSRNGWTTEFAALLPTLVVFAALLPQLAFLYMALGALAWPVSTAVLGLGAASLLPLLALATHAAHRKLMITAASIVVGGTLITLNLPTYSTEWPQRINLEYWLDADTGQSQYLACCDQSRLPWALAAAAHFDSAPRPRFAGSGTLAFYAAAPPLPSLHALAAPELSLIAQPASVGVLTHFQLHLRSLRGAPEVLVAFPASAGVAEVTVTTPTGPVRVKLGKLRGGATLLDIVSLPADGVQFAFDTAARTPLAVPVFDQSYALPEGSALQRARPASATSSQDGDLTVVQRTVLLSRG